MRQFWLVIVAFFMVCAVRAGEMEPFPAEAARTIRASQVDVIYHLQYSARGDAPASAGLFCPGCDTFHDRDLADYLTDQRDLELTGYLVGERTVLAPDLLIAADGIASIEVRFGKTAVPAKVTSVYPAEGGLRLELEKPLPEAHVLTFDENAEKPFFSYSRIRENGEWVERFAPYNAGAILHHPEMARRSVPQPGNSLILSKDGKAVALLLNNNELVGSRSWRTAWTQWREVAPEAMQQALAATGQRVLAGTAPVTIQFAPSKLSRRERLAGRMEREELDGIALMLPDGKIFSPFLLTPEQHSRVEKVYLRLPDGAREMKVVGAMKSFGGLVFAAADGKESGLKPIAAKCVPIAGVLGDMVEAARVHVYGRRAYALMDYDILGGTLKSFHGYRWGMTLKKYPGDVANVVFTPQGELVAVDVVPRLFNFERKMILLDASELEKLLNDPAETVPLTELSNPSNAVAFLGVEYQALSSEVAQSEEIANLTHNGAEGLLVSFVYPGSPAATLGLKPGDVLLKLLMPEGGAPIVLSGKDFAGQKEQQFPWEKLDAIPEMYFAEIPEPWPGVKDPLNLLFTRIGIGRKVQMIVIADHSLKKLDWTVAASPVYYDVAPEFRSAALGVSVRNVTFELRRFFRMAEDAPGVMVADVDAGSAASTAGLRPFEMITAVNDTPVRSVGEFEKAIAGETEVRLAVKRLAASRVVTVALPVGPRK